MKRLSILLFFAVSSIFSNAIAQQSPLPIEPYSNKISFSEVIVMDSALSANDLYMAAKEFIVSTPSSFQRSNSENQFGSSSLLIEKKGNAQTIDLLYKNDNPLKIDDPGKRLVAKGVFKYTGRDKVSAGIDIMYVEYVVNLAFKNGRYKIDITDFRYTNYNKVTFKQAQLGTWKDEGPCASKGVFEDLIHCDKLKKDFDAFYAAINAEMKKLSDELLKKMVLAKVGAKNNDW